MMELPIDHSDGEVRDVAVAEEADRLADSGAETNEAENEGEGGGSETEPEGSVGTEAMKADTHAA